MAKSKKAGGEPIASVAKVEKVTLDTTIAEDTLAAPRPSRKRAGEFFDFDGGDEDVDSNIPTKGTETKTAKSKKKPKIVPSSSDATRPNKLESHPVETPESHAGGDIVEVEPRRTSKRHKSKGKNDETAEPIPLKPLKPADKSSKHKKSKIDDLDTSVEEKEIVLELTTKIKEPGVSDSKAEDDTLSKIEKKLSKSKSKSKGLGKDHPTADNKNLEEIGEDAATRKQKPKPTETSKDHSKSMKENSKETGDGGPKPHSKSKALENDHDKVTAKNLEETGDDAVRAKPKSKEPGEKEPKAKTKKPKKAPEKDKDEATENIQVPHEQLQVTAPSDKIEPKTLKARDDTVTSTATKSKKSKKGKDASGTKGGSKTAVADSSDVHAEKVKEAAEPETSNPKKRKKSITASKDANQVLDHPAEEISAKKKRKKAEHSGLGAAGNIIGGVLSAGLATAAQGVNAVKDYAAEVANGKAKSIMDDTTQAAEAVVESNDNVESLLKKSSKGDGKSKKRVRGVDMNVGDDSEKAAATQSSVGLGDDAAVDEDDGEEAEEEEEEHEQTLALLNCFDSGDEDQFSGEEIFKQGQGVPKIPKKSVKKLKAAKDESEEPGVVFVGHIPHGFYEHEMNAYFSQFGNITRLRLSRNRKTGRSKHYAFIEFESAEVAKIVADTMDKYLLFGHILKCKFAAPEKLHPEVWKGANKRFKAVPWNKIKGRQLELPMGREGWEKRTEREKKRREGKNEKTKEIGYEYEGAQLKSVDQVLVREVPKQIEAEQAAADEIIEEEKTVIVQKGEEEGTMVISEETRTTRARRGDKQEAEEAVGDATAPEAKKVKKSKKAKATEQASPAIHNALEVVQASEAQTAAVVETDNDAIQERASSALGEAGKTTVAIQQLAPPTLKKARRARESLGGDSASLVKKLKDTAGATVADSSHKLEESIQDAAAVGSKLKKAKKSKQSK